MKFVYVIYVETTTEQLWQALTTTTLIRQYWWGRINESKWTKGARLESRLPDGELVWCGKILERKALRRLVHTFDPPGYGEDVSRVTFEIERPLRDNGCRTAVVKLTVTHDRLSEESKVYVFIKEGWPIILSSLKSFLESGNGISVLRR